MVNGNWDSGSSLEESIRKFTATAKMWNKKVFGHILKRNIINQLDGTQRALERFRSKNVLKIEKVLRVELEGILDMEESLWQQKVRSDWLTLGDRNTKYFHCKANSRRRINEIKPLDCQMVSGAAMIRMF